MAVILGLILGALDEASLECEEAIAHLQDCCNGLDAANVCGGGCSGVTLSLAESACIQDRTCDALLAAGVCQRVTALSNDPPAADETYEEVCP